MKRAFLILTLLAVASIPASADTIGLSNLEAESLLFITSSSPLLSNNLHTGGGRYTASWPGAIGPEFVESGLSFAARGDDDDIFVITIRNVNENPWDFQIALNNGTMSSPIVSIAVGSSFTFSVVTTAPITQFSLFVSGNLPLGINGDDRTAEYVVQPVPEPASMLLLGTGLVGAAGAVRRRLKARS